MADINTLFRVIMSLSEAIKSSNYRQVRRLLRRLQYVITKLRLNFETLNKAMSLYREPELDLRVRYIVEESTIEMDEHLRSNPDLVDDDYITRLSNTTVDALEEFYMEQQLEEERLVMAHMGDLDDFQPQEDWQLSQFWYDDRTAGILAREALAVAGEHGRIACVSSPTVYRKIINLKPATVEVKCLEFDNKFKMFGNDFIFYDFNEPLNLDVSLKNHFDVVIADPPFLSGECLTKTALTLKYLAKDKIILCTGAVMGNLAHKLLDVSPCEFKPTHQNQLQNEFTCYTNYESEILNSEH